MNKRRSILWIILSKLFELIFLLIIIPVLNFLVPLINEPIFTSIVGFINENVLLLIVMSLVFMIGSIFYALFFPLNLPAPIITAIASIFLIIFLKRVFMFIDSITNTTVFPIFNIFSYALYPIVFFFVLVGGYITIFTRLLVVESVNKQKKEKIINVKRVKSFEDVGKEFGQAFSDLFEAIKHSFRKK